MLGVTYSVSWDLLSFSVVIIYHKMAFYYLGLPEILCKSVWKGWNYWVWQDLESVGNCSVSARRLCCLLLLAAPGARAAQVRRWVVEKGLPEELRNSAARGEWFDASSGLGFHCCCPRWRVGFDVCLSKLPGSPESSPPNLLSRKRSGHLNKHLGTVFCCHVWGLAFALKTTSEC